MAIYWNIESKEYNSYYVLYSSNNTYFANNIMNARIPVEKQRRLAIVDANIPLKDLIKEEAKDAGYLHFTVTNQEFIKKATPFQNKIKTSRNRIGDLERLIAEINAVASKVTAGLSLELPNTELKAKYFNEIEELKNKIIN
jgi:hypothetical protein